MRVPRDLSSDDLIKSLASLDYEVIRQTGSHIRLRTDRNGQHNITIPAHNPIKLGTLTAILRDVASHFQITRNQLLERLFSDKR
ncbi:MAG: type II toxin-antitoxin system HicA family toxin [Cyanobacteria bacterium J06650_10]